MANNAPKRGLLRRLLRTRSAATEPQKADGVPHITGMTVTADSVLTLAGSHLRFDEADAAQGEFAVTEARTVRCATVIKNSAECVIVLLPASVVAKDFGVVVRTSGGAYAARSTAL